MIKRLQLIASLCIVALVIAAYSNVLHAPFIFDDGSSIEDNATIRSLAAAWFPPSDSGITVSGRPLLNFTFALNYALNGVNVTGYHIFNICIHIISTLLLFALIKRGLTLYGLKGKPAIDVLLCALAITGLWALHPLQTESVTYIVQRAEALVGLFYFLTLYSAFRYFSNPEEKLWLVVGIASSALGMLCKEVMFTAPIMVLYCEVLTSADLRWQGVLKKRKIFYSAMFASWGIFIVSFLQSGSRGGTVGLGVSAWKYALTQCEAIVHYVRLAFWPSSLTLDYGQNLVGSLGDVWPYAVILCCALVGVAYGSAKRKQWAVAGTFFFLVLMPSSSFIPIVTQTMAEHRMYLPLVAVVTTVVVIVYNVCGRIGTVCICVLIPILALLTYERNRDYASGIGIWKANVATAPGNPRGWYSLARNYMQQNKLDESDAAMSEALRLKPSYTEALLGMATIQYKKGNIDDAVDIYNNVFKEIEIKPNASVYEGLNNYGVALVQLGRFAEGVERLEKATLLKPDAADAYLSLGNAMSIAGRYDQAIVAYSQAIGKKPKLALSYVNYARALVRLGHQQEALELVRKGLQDLPDDPALFGCRGEVLASIGDLVEALKSYEKAVLIDPTCQSAYIQIGVIKAGMSDIRGACEALEKAIALGGRDGVLYATAGRMLFNAGDSTRALMLLKQAVEFAPADPAIRMAYARTLISLGQHTGAVEQLKAIVALAPTDTDAHLLMANEYVALGLESDAAREYRAILRMQPDNAEANYYLRNRLGK